MRDDNLNIGSAATDDVDLDRREVLASLAKYSATVAGASAVVLTASASVSAASISGDGGRRNPGNDKPVGKSPFDGVRGQVPSGRDKDGPPGRDKQVPPGQSKPGRDNPGRDRPGRDK